MLNIIEMKSELYNAIKSINVENLTETDKVELLKIFINTECSLIRNQVAFILADIKYIKAIPHIIEKINNKDLFDNNGSLVFALDEMDTPMLKNYFLNFISIICEQGYEARYQAFEIVNKYKDQISDEERIDALKILYTYLSQFSENEVNDNANSKLSFINQTIDLMQKNYPL